MKIKQLIKLIITNSVFVLVLVFVFTSCHTDTKTKTDDSPLPLNISVFLDLSDRITMTNDGMSQIQKDTTILGYIRNILIDDIQSKNVTNSDCCFRVFFYPSPNIEGINKISESMEYDFSSYKIEYKKHKAINLRDSLVPTLAKLYDSTLTSKNWIGSDIYGFMESKVENGCIKEGYRNILIILSDGFIYDKNNWNKDGDFYTGITPISLKAGQQGIISIKKKISNLEVLFLEVNTPQAANSDKVKNMIKDWFNDMGISHIVVESTDLPNNTKNVLNNFFKDK